MKLATFDDYAEIMAVFKPHIKTVFPYMRKDYLQRKIAEEKVIFDTGVVIIFGEYQRKQKIGTCQAQKGDMYISEIVSAGIPLRASLILTEFFSTMKRSVWLTVRSENIKARKFYEKNDMKNVGNISWMSGTLPGVVYKKEFVTL